MNRPMCHTALWTARSLVDEAVQFLERADSTFARRRRNCAWTTWFFHRRLRSITLSVWSSIFALDRPLPYLSVEECPGQSDTLADQLVDQAIRLIRFDVYRLAMMLNDYVDCLVALRCRRILCPDEAGLAGCERRMAKKLNDALAALQEATSKRNLGGSRNTSQEKAAELDKYVVTFITSMSSEAAQVERAVQLCVV